MNWLRPETFAELDLPLRILPLRARPLDPKKEWVPLRRDARDGLYDWYHPQAGVKVPFFASLNPAGDVQLMYLVNDDSLRLSLACPSTDCVLRVVEAAGNRSAIEVGPPGHEGRRGRRRARPGLRSPRPPRALPGLLLFPHRQRARPLPRRRPL